MQANQGQDERAVTSGTAPTPGANGGDAQIGPGCPHEDPHHDPPETREDPLVAAVYRAMAMFREIAKDEDEAVAPQPINVADLHRQLEKCGEFDGPRDFVSRAVQAAGPTYF